MLQDYIVAFFNYLFLFMIQFFKDSVRELTHVVWPTREETKNFFIIVMIILTLFWLYLFIASTIFSEIMLYLRNTFWWIGYSNT